MSWPNDSQLHQSCELGSSWLELGVPFGQGLRIYNTGFDTTTNTVANVINTAALATRTSLAVAITTRVYSNIISRREMRLISPPISSPVTSSCYSWYQRSWNLPLRLVSFSRNALFSCRGKGLRNMWESRPRIQGLKQGLDKTLNLSLPYISVILAWSYFELAQSSVNGQMGHENIRSRLVVGQVIDEMCLTNGKIYWPQIIGHGFCRALKTRLRIIRRLQCHVLSLDPSVRKPALEQESHDRFKWRSGPFTSLACQSSRRSFQVRHAVGQSPLEHKGLLD